MEEEEFKTLLVTSSVPEEGKTAFSVNLAIIEAKLGKNVILVDCDMRRPSVAKAMNQEGEFPGLQAVLQGKVKISEAMTTIELPSVVLPYRICKDPGHFSSSIVVIASLIFTLP